MTRRSWAMFAAMCVIWGIPYLLIRVAVREVQPPALVLLRTGLGGLVLLPFALRRGGFGWIRARWRPLLAFSAIEIAVPWLLLNDAERHLPSSLTGLLVAGVPLVGVVLARLLGGERTSGAQLAGLLLGLAGVAMLVGLDLGGLRPVSLLELVAVVVGYAVAPVIMARRLADLPPVPVVSASLLLVAVAYLPFGLAGMSTHLAPETIWSIVVLALVCTALAFVVFFALIAAIGPARATVITYVNPAVAVVLGVLLLNERLTVGMMIGFPLILAGSVLAARKPSGAREAAAPEGSLCEPIADDQSMRTDPWAVSNVAATSPAPTSSSSRQETEMPSNGWRADVPR